MIDEYNDWYNKKDIFFMGFHPLNPANEEEQEFLVTPDGSAPVVESDLDYSMMLIQKFSQLQEASDKLHRHFAADQPVNRFRPEKLPVSELMIPRRER